MVNGLMVFIVIFFAPNTIFIVTSRVFDRIYCHIAGLRPHLLPLRWSSTAFIAASHLLPLRGSATAFIDASLVCDRIYCRFEGLRPLEGLWVYFNKLKSDSSHCFQKISFNIFGKFFS